MAVADLPPNAMPMAPNDDAVTVIAAIARSTDVHARHTNINVNTGLGFSHTWAKAQEQSCSNDGS